MKRKCIQQIKKKLLRIVVVTLVVISMFSTDTVMAEPITEKYPYTLFAGANKEGAITIDAENVCVNGNVTTNGSIISTGNLNINGLKIENANLEMVYITDKINAMYFQEDIDSYSDSYFCKETNININIPMNVQGELELVGNINLNEDIKVLEKIILNGEVKNANSSVICSEIGDIVINGTNVNLNGLIYAPYGEVKITAQNLNLNSVIIIANTITLSCSSTNINPELFMSK